MVGGGAVGALVTRLLRSEAGAVYAAPVEPWADGVGRGAGFGDGSGSVFGDGDGGGSGSGSGSGDGAS